MKRKRVLSALMMATIVGLLTAACFSDDSAERKSIVENQTLWESAGGQNYEFTYRRTCFCPPEYAAKVFIEVRQGEVWSVEYRLAELHMDPPDPDGYPTIPELFDKLLEADDQGADEMRLAFDDNFGFPEDVYIDRDRRKIDEEFGFTVSSFVRK